MFIDLTDRVRAISTGITAIAVEKKLLEDDAARVVSLGSEAVSRLELKPEVDKFLEELQARVHERSIGKIETLLTAIIRDVFPEKNDKVSISAETKRDNISLSISVTDEFGENAEDAYTGRGGSISNVLSLGLRFIALSRSAKLRKFIVLDEADCWLKSERIPLFANIISLLSKEMGVQVLMVSHHDPKFFEHCASMVNVAVIAPKTIAVESYSGLAYEWGDDQEGIRSVTAKNFMSYNDVTIPLSPGITVITGDNDIGKSGLLLGFRALARNEGKDSLIRHGQQTASFSVDLGGAGVLSWERDAKGAKKTRYKLVSQSGGPIHQSDASSTPEWVSDLGFDTGDLDIQICEPKKPVFLLDKSGAQQATILTVGKEGRFLVDMQSIHKADSKKFALIKKESEEKISALNARLAVIRKLDLEKGMECLAKIDSEIKAQQSTQQEIDTLESLIDKLFHLEKFKGISVIKEVLVAPDDFQLNNLLNILKNIHALGKTASHKKIEQPSSSFSDSNLLASIELSISKISEHSWQEGLRELTPLKNTDPDNGDIKAIIEIGKKISQNKKILSAIGNERLKPVELDMISLDGNSEDLLANLINQIVEQNAKAEYNRASIDKIKTESQLLEDEIAKHAKTCPVCGK